MRHAARRQARHGRAPPARGGDGTGRGRPVQRQPLVRVGPVPLRARVGHGARGLQRQRRRVALVPARPRPLALVPLERGRDGGALRHPARAVPRVVAVERRRPDPQGADVRADRSRGQPRRGREGVLVVRGRAAQPRVAAVALPLPAGGVPLPAAHRRERPPQQARSASTSCSTPACSRTTGSGRWRSPTRRSHRPRCSRASPSRTADPTRRPSTCCPRCGSATGGGGTPTSPCRSSPWTATRSWSRGTASRGTGSRPQRDPTVCRRARCSATTRRTPLACTAARRSRRTRRTASTTTSSRGRTRSTPSTAAPRRPGGTT